MSINSVYKKVNEERTNLIKEAPLDWVETSLKVGSFICLVGILIIISSASSLNSALWVGIGTTSLGAYFMGLGIVSMILESINRYLKEKKVNLEENTFATATSLDEYRGFLEQEMGKTHTSFIPNYIEDFRGTTTLDQRLQQVDRDILGQMVYHKNGKPIKAEGDAKSTDLTTHYGEKKEFISQTATLKMTDIIYTHYNNKGLAKVEDTFIQPVILVRQKKAEAGSYGNTKFDLLENGHNSCLKVTQLYQIDYQDEHARATTLGYIKASTYIDFMTNKATVFWTVVEHEPNPL